jgi:hypothetical protein
VSFAFGLLAGVSISSALCFFFPAFFAGLANSPGHLAGLEEEMKSLFVMSGVVTVACTLFFRWLLPTRQFPQAEKANSNGNGRKNDLEDLE